MCSAVALFLILVLAYKKDELLDFSFHFRLWPFCTTNNEWHGVPRFIRTNRDPVEPHYVPSDRWTNGRLLLLLTPSCQTFPSHEKHRRSSSTSSHIWPTYMASFLNGRRTTICSLRVMDLFSISLLLLHNSNYDWFRGYGGATRN